MNWVSVDSRAFAAVAYRRGERQLCVRFHSGKIYRYFDFPPGQYEELLAAESKGTYFSENIRDKFGTRRLARRVWVRIWSIPR